jgi:hypothetical protein
VRSRAADWPDMPATCGSRSQRRRTRALQHRSKPIAPPIERLFPKVLTVELQQVEGIEADLIVVRPRVKLAKICNAVLSEQHGLAVDRLDHFDPFVCAAEPHSGAL